MQSPHYKSHHLHCQVALFGMEYQYCVMDHVLPQLARLYGSGEFFFPISFQEYLKYLLRKNSWGDQLVVYIILKMWNLKISIVVASGCTMSGCIYEVPICHNGGMRDADIILAFDGVDHYSAVVCQDNSLVTYEKISLCTDDDVHFSTEYELLQPDEDIRSPDPTFILPKWDKYLRKRDEAHLLQPDAQAIIDK